MRTGSLCTGYGGLDLAVEEVLGGELAFVADVDPGACTLLAHRFPGVPNIGDIKTVDWVSLGAVDVLGAGYPCQPWSQAGRRRGTEDERHLWPYIAKGIGILQPPLVVLENVHGHLTLGFDVVLADLAALGYDAEWVVVTASAAGACHRRARLLILAFPAGQRAVTGVPVAAASDGGWLRPDESLFGMLPFTGHMPASGRMAGGRVYAAEDGPTSMATGLLKTPTAQLAVNGGSQHPDKRRAGGHGPTLADQVEWELLPRALGPRAAGDTDLPEAVALLPTPRATDGEKGGPNQRGSSGDLMLPSAVMQFLPTPTAKDAANARNATAGRSPGSAYHAGTTLCDVFHEDPPTATDWGPYEAAIRRWEAVTGRPAPRPTVAGRTGQRLNPELPEWMMGLPAGWITEVPGLSRNAMLKLAGNGVVPAQAELALRILLDRAGLDSLGRAA